jgi:hypothetical protein
MPIGNPTLTMKFLEYCEAGELIRGQFTETIEWAIIAERQENCPNVFVISGDRAPWCFDANKSKNMSNLVCLSYGKSFEILPDHAGSCNIVRGDLFNSNGTIIYACPFVAGAKTIPYLSETIGQAATERRYLNLDEFRIVSEPGGK